MDLDSLRTLAKLNRIQLPTESELLVAKTYVDAQRAKKKDNEEGDGDDSEVEELASMSILQYLYPVREAFPAVFKLFCAVETFPFSTTISECSFSSLARVGILGRVHMSNERLRGQHFWHSKRRN